MSRHRLTDQHWELIKDPFPRPARTGRPPRDRRPIVDAILWLLRTGAPWRDILCDGHGHPLDFHLTAEQAHETTALVPLLEGANERVTDGDGGPVVWPLALAGDKG